MKLKLTPLNIVSAVCLTAGILLLVNKKQSLQATPDALIDLMAGLTVLAAIIAFLSDQIFRKFIPSVKKLWVVEGVLVIFILILILIIKTSTR
ncbi:MAG TPA: hypothetical protein VF679_00385 [Pedobacter sp.]